MAAASAIWVLPPLWQRLHASGVAATLERGGFHVAWFGLAGLCVVGLIRSARRAVAGAGIWRRHFSIAIWLLVIVVLIRLPFWSRTVFNADVDEGAVIVVAQSLLDGNLPFTEIWDIKPPGAAAGMALLIAFGGGMLPIRAGAAILVLGSAWLLTIAGTRSGHRLVWAPLLLIVFVSAAEGGQATLTEHLALLPLTAFLVIALRRPHRVVEAATMGLALGLATLIRSNLGLIVPAAIVAVIWRSPRTGRAAIANLLTFFSTLVAPWAVVALLYFARGEFDELIRGVVTAPLATPHVSLTGIPFAIDDLVLTLAIHAAQHAVLLWFAVAGAIVSMARSVPSQQRDDERLVTLLLVFTLLSVMATSAGAQHHLMQAMPFAAWLAGRWLERVARARTWMHAIIATGLIIPLLGVPGHYANLIHQVRRGDGFFADDEHKVSAYLRREGATGRFVFSLDETIVSAWLAGGCHAGRFADMGELGKPSLLRAFAGADATSESELLEAFTVQPLFVVLRTGGSGVGDRGSP